MKTHPALLLLPLLAAIASAQHTGDILLYTSNATIKTAAIRADQSVDYDARLFVATLGVVAPNFTADPGFDSLPGTFPAGSRNGFTILDSLRIWNGSDFTSISPSSMSLSFATLERFTPASPQPVAGFTLAVGSNGQWHRHLDYVLQPPAENGLYLLSLQIFSTNTAITPSPPFWIVFNQNQSQDEQARALQWVLDTYLSPTPCPADFNQDGGVDGADVESFFIAWAAADTSADVNIDGGVDGSDVETFFLAWAAGGCG